MTAQPKQEFSFPASSADGNPRAPYLVVDGFLPLDVAQAMRADIEAHFDNPARHKADTHQVWNYWHVPELYTYLRTSPEKVIRPERVQGFYDALRIWSIGRLGMAHVTWPYLSLYVSGCRQALHNDATNGRFGFVYSLTPDERKTTGGGTVVMHEGDPFRSKLTTATAGRGLYNTIEPRFNRLVVFDDRLPHAVDRIDGVMDPKEGRIVLHGHLSEAQWVVDGPLAPAIVSTTLAGALQAENGPFRNVLTPSGAIAWQLFAFHGPIVLRFAIGTNGRVEECRTLIDRVASPQGGDDGWEQLRGEVIGAITGCAFPSAESRTMVTLPLLFGGKLASVGG